MAIDTKQEKIKMVHGGGGQYTQKLLEKSILPKFKNKYLDTLADGAIVKIGNEEAVFTTDSFVIRPLFFSGGDIGKLAICGTVNDLSVMGGEPLYLSCSFIIEEDFLISDLEVITSSMQKWADFLNIMIVTGDTKVVEKGCGDGIYINTSGIGKLYNGFKPAINEIKKGDHIILSGTIGDHGIAIINERENLGFKANIESDCAPLWPAIKELLDNNINIRIMRDPTRGGLSASLNEISIHISKSNLGIELFEEKIPIHDEIRSIAEILGFDILDIANEGKFVAVTAREDALRAVEILKKNHIGKDASIIGEITSEQGVFLKTSIGGKRIIDMPLGELLPRIC